MSFWDDISARLAALSGSATPLEARNALNEFNARDIEAVRVSEGGGGNGGSGPLSVIGPFPIAHDTPGLINPSDNGALFGPVLPAGTVVFCVWVATTVQWECETDANEIDIGLNVTATGLVSLQQSVLAWLNNSSMSLTTVSAGIAIPEPPAYLRAVTGQIAIAIYTDTSGAMTAGEGDVYALAYIPA